jgi:hypothetical protein
MGVRLSASAPPPPGANVAETLAQARIPLRILDAEQLRSPVSVALLHVVPNERPRLGSREARKHAEAQHAPCRRR